MSESLDSRDPVQSLTSEQIAALPAGDRLDALVARAMGMRPRPEPEDRPGFWWRDGDRVRPFRPSTYWSDCGEAVERWRVRLEYDRVTGHWSARVTTDECDREARDASPLVAACRAVALAARVEGMRLRPDVPGDVPPIDWTEG